MAPQARALRLVGDVGGTHARFGLVARDREVGAVAVFACADFDSLEAALSHYLGGRVVAAAVLAVAGPVERGEVELTNRAWRTSEAKVEARCGIGQVRLCNDYVALAHAAPRLQARDLHHLGGPPARGSGVVAVMGAGTGFGAAALVGDGATRTAVVGEAGHVAFAPTDDAEVEILRRLTRRYGRVSLERILSGPGLAALHAIVCDLAGAPDPRCDAAAVIARAAAGDALAVDAVERFCAILGAAAGDLALVYGARSVQVAGGMAPRMLDVLDRGGFRARFEAKGRLEGAMRAISTHAVLDPYAALIGAATLLPPLGEV